MSKRLQVILNPEEYSMVRKASTSEKKSVSDWVRGLIRGSLAKRGEQQRKDLIHAFRQLNLPAPPIDKMLDEIEKGRF